MTDEFGTTIALYAAVASVAAITIGMSAAVVAPSAFESSRLIHAALKIPKDKKGLKVNERGTMPAQVSAARKGSNGTLVLALIMAIPACLSLAGWYLTFASEFGDLRLLLPFLGAVMAEVLVVGWPCAERARFWKRFKGDWFR